MSERVKVTSKTPESKRDNSVSQKQGTNLSHPLRSPVNQILFLQRTIGNQAVQRLFKVGGGQRSAVGGRTQAKLKIGQPGDIYEQEADRVADAVMRMRTAPELLQAKHTRNTPEPTGEGGECEDKGLILQCRTTDQGEISTVPPIVHEVLRSPGQPLDSGTRDFMEQRFGHDFSQVRVYTDSKAAESAQSVNALAYTVGRNVVFGEGQYEPGKSFGQKLLAHELSHVIQQGDREVAPQTLSIDEPVSSGEREAEQAALDVETGNVARLSFGRLILSRQKAVPDFKGPDLTLDPRIRSLIMQYCLEGKLDPFLCFEIMKSEPLFKLTEPDLGFGSSAQYGFNVPGLELGKRPEPNLSMEAIRKLLEEVDSYKIKLQTMPPPTKSSPTKPSSSGLPDIGISKLTTHELNIRIGKLKIVIPKSAELKFNSFSLSPRDSMQISVKGEINDLAKLFESSEQDKALGPPVGISLSVTYNATPKFAIEANSAMDLSNKTATVGLMFKITGSQCSFVIPKSVFDKIKEAQSDLEKYAGVKVETGEKADAPPSSDLAKAANIIETIDKLYQTIQEIDKAKGKCQTGPTVGVGPSVTFPIEGGPYDPFRGPLWSFGVKLYF